MLNPPTLLTADSSPSTGITAPCRGVHTASTATSTSPQATRGSKQTPRRTSERSRTGGAMTTNRKRWVVWRDNTLAINWINPWVAAARDPSDYGYAGKFFPTHAEALAYADRMARTVEVTLPRSVGTGGRVLGTQQLHIGIAYHAGEKTVWVEDQSNSMIDIQLHELQPLALALLALHHTNQKTYPRHNMLT